MAENRRNVRFHQPSPAAADYSKGLDIGAKNNIYALHTGIRGGKEKRALTTSIIIRDIAADHERNSKGAGGDENSAEAAADKMYTTAAVPTPEMLMKQSYRYPIMTNGELKRLMDRFRIRIKEPISGDKLVCMMGEEIRNDLRPYVDNDSQCSSYLNALIDSFPSLKPIRPPHKSSYVHLLAFILGWIVTLQGIPDIVVPSSAGESHLHVSGLDNKRILCEASQPITRKRKVPVSAATTSEEKEVDFDDEEIDHAATLAMMTKSIDISLSYSSPKAVLCPEYIMVLHEILNYDQPNISLDRALSVVNNRIDTNESKLFNIMQCINNVNTLIQAFDVYDIPNLSPDFEKNVNNTAAVRNIVFPICNTESSVRSKDNLDNIKRFSCFVKMGNLPYSNIEPSEFSNIIITPNRKFDSIDNVIRAHGLTPYLCLKYLENLMCLSRPQLRSNVDNRLIYPRYQDSSVFDLAARSVAEGKYLTPRLVHNVSTISVAKRYTCLALMETYLELDFHEKLQRFYYARNENYMWYIYHALFFRRIDLYKYMIERAYVIGSSLEQSMTKGGAVNEVALLQMRNIVTLPIMLLLDAYDQCYKCGGPNHTCTFRATTNVNLHKHPRLFDPTKQCMLYHTAMTSMQVPIATCESYQNVCMKYFRTVFFGRNAATKDIRAAKYSAIANLITLWYQFVTCRMLEMDESLDALKTRSAEDRIRTAQYMRTRPIIGPNTRIMRNAIPTESIVSDIEGFKVSPVSDPFGGAAIDTTLPPTTKFRMPTGVPTTAVTAAGNRRFVVTSKQDPPPKKIDISRILQESSTAPQAQPQPQAGQPPADQAAAMDVA